MSSEHISLSWKVIFKINNAYIPFFNNSFFIRRANKRNNVCSSSWNQIIIQTQHQCIYGCNFIYYIGIWSDYYGLFLYYSVFDVLTIIIFLEPQSRNIYAFYHFWPWPKNRTFFQDNNNISSVGEIAAAKFYWQLKKEGEGCQREQVPRKIIPLAVLPDKILEWQRDLT